MSPKDRLMLAAKRILSDGLPHSDSAICWAIQVVNGVPFSEDEIRLGLEVDGAL